MRLPTYETTFEITNHTYHSTTHNIFSKYKTKQIKRSKNPIYSPTSFHPRPSLPGLVKSPLLLTAATSLLRLSSARTRETLCTCHPEKKLIGQIRISRVQILISKMLSSFYQLENQGTLEKQWFDQLSQTTNQQPL